MEKYSRTLLRGMLSTSYELRSYTIENQRSAEEPILRYIALLSELTDL